MPIEIKELIIRSTITDGEEQLGRPSEQEFFNVDDIVEKAVERIIEILKQKEDR